MLNVFCDVEERMLCKPNRMQAIQYTPRFPEEVPRCADGKYSETRPEDTVT